MLILIILVLGFWLVVGLGLAAAFIAWKKGYPPWFWLVSMGPVGALWILLTPSLDQATTPEDRERWETRANWTGGMLSGFTILPMFGLPLIVLVGYFAWQSVPVGPPAPPPTLNATVVTDSVIEETSSKSDSKSPGDTGERPQGGNRN